MNNFLHLLGKWLKTFLHFLNNFFTHLSVEWQEERTSRQLFYNSIHWNKVSLTLQEELFEILKNSAYDYFNNLHCPNNLINYGWEIRENEVLYCFDVYTPNPPSNFILEQIRQKLNIEIAQHQAIFLQQYGDDLACLIYPCIYYGMYIMSMKRNGVMIQFKVATHLSHRCM